MLLEFSALESVVLLILPRGHCLPCPPNIYLCDNVLACVESFKYLANIILADFVDALIWTEKGENFLLEGIFWSKSLTNVGLKSSFIYLGHVATSSMAALCGHGSD